MSSPSHGRSVRIQEERPPSLYDNLPPSGDPPSMAPLMVTTVPQNLAAPKIEGRHAPTRTSLRHSRMIVMTKQGKVSRKYLPPVLHQHKLAKSLLVLILLVGCAVGTLSLWLLVWAPNLNHRDVPYWSALPVLCSALVGLFLVCSCRKEYPGMPLACYVYSIKVISVVLSLVASTLSFCASGFGAVHLFRLYMSDCEPANVLNASCHCVTTSAPWALVYPDLNCPEVVSILSILIIASTSANFIAGFLTFWYVYLHWANRYVHTYSQVRTNDSRPIVITNNI